MVLLHYGTNSSVKLDFAADCTPLEIGIPRGNALRDVSEAAIAALKTPLEFPPLALATTPSDKVVIAVESGIPGEAEVTTAVIESLMTAGISENSITILRHKPDNGQKVEDPRRLLPKLLRERITLVNHDPGDRRQLAYLAANKAGDAILVNRALHNADVVVPIGCLHPEGAAGYFGIHGLVFPTFSDEKTLQRFRNLKVLNRSSRQYRELRAEVEHVAHLLGMFFTIQVVPGNGNNILHILCGESETVRQRARSLYNAAWGWEATKKSHLVVAAIAGNNQSWETFGQALQVAGQFVDENGVIVICCDLQDSPGPAMRRLSYFGSHDVALEHVDRDRPVDALVAAQLAEALNRGKVYLLSKLEPSVVEELDMIPIIDQEELKRLIRQYHSCALLSNAPNIAV